MFRRPDTLKNSEVRAEAVARFLASLDDVRWLESAGQPWDGPTVPDVATAWDEWNEAMLEAWLANSKPLELQAARQLGDAAVTATFDEVSAALRPVIHDAVLAYFGRRPDNLNENTECSADLGLYPELTDSILRDLCWAAVESLLVKPGFFTSLVTVYRRGRWPCSWLGSYPDGEVVVL